MPNRLAYFLRKAPPVPEVTVNFAQVAELIGEDKAHELAIFETKKTELRKGRVGRRSAIPARKRIDVVGLAGFKRQELLDAIDLAKGKNFQASDETSEYSGVPNQDLLPEVKRQELKRRGFVS